MPQDAAFIYPLGEKSGLGLFERLAAGTDLTVNEAKGVFERIMAGQLNDVVITGPMVVVDTRYEGKTS